MDQSAGAENHDTPSIGGFVGLLPLLILASSQDCDTALATAEMLGMDFMEERCHVMYVETAIKGNDDLRSNRWHCPGIYCCRKSENIPSILGFLDKFAGAGCGTNVHIFQFVTRGLEEISQQFFGALGARMVPKPPIFADYFTNFTVVKNHVTMSFMSRVF